MSACKVCEADNRDVLELEGLAAVRGDQSWRFTANKLGWSHHASLKNHMEKHYQPPELEGDLTSEIEEQLRRQIQATELELLTNATNAPPEVAALYLAAARNLRGLAETKPSQQMLVASLKGIHEITGMKMGQQMLLAFARAQFGDDAPGAGELEQKHTTEQLGVLEAVIVPTGDQL